MRRATEHSQYLSALASVEKDPEKLLVLTQEINRLLEQERKPPRKRPHGDVEETAA
jgi:hypothetical protein